MSIGDWATGCFVVRAPCQVAALDVPRRSACQRPNPANRLAAPGPRTGRRPARAALRSPRVCSTRVGSRIDLSPLVVVRRRGPASFYAHPLADPRLVCVTATLDEALTTQATFLADYLAKLPADQLARFVFPKDTSLVEIPVRVNRPDLPRRFAIDRPIAIPCVLVPDVLTRHGPAADSAEPSPPWVHILPLRHIIHVAPGADLCTRVGDEVRRIVAAREPTPLQFLELFPADEIHLLAVDLVVERSDLSDLGQRTAARRAKHGQRSREQSRKLLAEIGDDMLRPSLRSHLPPRIGRDREIRRLAALLGSDRAGCVALVGPSGCGKTSVIEELLSQRIVEFRTRPVFATSGARLVAGQSGFGQLQDRVTKVMAAAEEVDAILYFDSFADLFAGRPGGMEDLTATMRPWISAGRVRIVGESTPEAFEQHEKHHGALMAAFQRLAIEPLSLDATRTLLRARNDHMRRRHPDRPALAAEAIEPLLELCERYFPEQAQPGKAVRLFDELRAVHEHDVTPDGSPYTIGVHDVHRAFGRRTGIPMFLLREDQRLRRATLDDEFRRRVIGQHEAVARVIDTLCAIKARLQPPGKPLANFLFVGPTGVGKTEVAKTLAHILFGASDRLVRFDMSEYADPYAAERLIRGTDRDDGELTRRVRQQPFCVLLLDEIEKAHPAVFDLLLQVLGEGRLTDARGQTTWFHNAIVIMTSNLGASHRGRSHSGFGGRADAFDAEAERRHYVEQVDRHFRPEFVNRIDRVIPFSSLREEEIAAVAEVSLKRFRERSGLVNRSIELRVTPDALARIATVAYSPAYGARALRRGLEDELVAPIARLLSNAGGDADGALVVAGVDAADVDRSLAAESGQVIGRRSTAAIALAIVRRARHRLTPHLAPLAQIARLRRNVDACMQLEPIVETRARIAYLTADLARGQRSAGPHAKANMLGSLREHERIREALARLDACASTLATIEELALAAAGEGLFVDERVEEARAAHATFEREFVITIFSVRAADAITLELRRLGSPERLLQHFDEVVRIGEQRGWQMTVHRHLDPKRGGDWPHDVAWGPPRKASELRDQLLAHDDPTWSACQALLIRASGTCAGGLLGCDAGLHRRWYVDRARPDHTGVRVLAWSAHPSKDDLSSDRYGLSQATPQEQLPKLVAAREVFADGSISLARDGIVSTPNLDLESPGLLERLLFGAIVARVADGRDPLMEDGA